VLLRLSVAAGLGAAVGVEREFRDREAGIRTHLLVALGAGLFTIISAYGFHEFLASGATVVRADPTRIAAQIVTGIGFLGAGAILHGPGIVKGMTTAATIWAMAATGMIVGIGYVGSGLGLSLLVRFVLSVALSFENRALGAQPESRVELVFAANGGKTRIQIEKIMEDFHVVGSLNIGEVRPDGTVRATFQCRLPRSHRREFLNELAGLPEMRELAEREQ